MSLELPENWKTELPVEMQSSGVIENVNNIEALVKMAIDGRNLASTALRIPSQDASVEDRTTFNNDLMTKLPNLIARPNEGEAWDGVWDKLGRPKEATSYDLGDIPDAMKKSMSELTAKAHTLGLTQAQMKGMSEAITGDYTGSVETAKTTRAEQIDALKTEWGGSYDANVSSIAHFIEQTGFGEHFVNAAKEGQMSVGEMKAWQTVVKGFEGEGVNIGKQPNNQSGDMTPGEAKMRISEMWSDKEGPLLNNGHPDHEAAVKRNFELHKIAEAGREKTEVELFRASLAG